MREAVAIRLIVAKKTNARMTQIMAVAPPVEFVNLHKYGYPVGLITASSTLCAERKKCVTISI